MRCEITASRARAADSAGLYWYIDVVRSSPSSARLIFNQFHNRSKQINGYAGRSWMPSLRRTARELRFLRLRGGSACTAPAGGS